MHRLRNHCLVLSLSFVSIALSGCGVAPVPASSGAASTPVTTTNPPQGPPLSIGAPSSGTSVNSPFTLTASASVCNSQSVTSIGYELDTSATPVTVTGTALNVQVTAAAGAHTVNVLAFGSTGAQCSASVAVTVAQPTPPPTNNSPVPAGATTVSAIQSLSNWEEQHDTGTSGSSTGAMQLASSPSLSGSAREFTTTYASSGGELYHVTFASDPNAHNFFYDTWVYLNSSVSSMANLEMDMNQVLANGDTIIYGFQCDGYSGTWDYTENAGTPAAPVDRWLHSTAACNVRNWTQNTWHHVQVSYSRDDSGNVTYESVWLDGTEQQINETVPSAFALNWASVLLTNFQIDGLGSSGSNTVYMDNLSISRW